MRQFTFARLCRIVLLLVQAHFLAFGQGQYSRKYEGPDDPAGEDAWTRSGDLNGNRMYFNFSNNSGITDTGPGRPTIWNRWPNTYEGSTLVHGINLVITCHIHVAGDTVPVTDPAEIASRTDLKDIYLAQQGWRMREDKDPTGTFGWGLKPPYGYINELSETPAMSNSPFSWPPLGWPSRGDQLKWPGEWNGRFGRGVVKADLESFWVLNDAQDQEFLGAEDSIRYYPRPGVKIGDKRPQITEQKGLPWGGVGLRMEVRPFQWNHPEARDAVFMEYLVANISDYDLPEVCFGYYCHPWIGQDWGLDGDDYLYFNKSLNMTFNWDRDGVGTGGIPTCAFGMAYLESPAKPVDGIDNDDDGLTDEKRDNPTGKKIGPMEGISDISKFLAYYHLSEADLKEHWDADEDQDWQDGDDKNGNGVYDADENPGDDVGLDGVGPGELNYFGPDADGTECNHKPDFVEGYGCEPNFAFTDINESDMLGLTSYHTYNHQSEQAIHEDDERYFKTFADATFEQFYDRPGSWVTLFATGTFPLYKGLTERISMAVIASFDALEGLNSSDHRSPSLWRKKEVAQVIYESDYRFAQPPLMPTLTATAADGKVLLTWDNLSDTRTREALLQNKNDFEGYKLFKATDKKFTDPEIITDGRGIPMYKKAIFQCDLKDNIYGFSDYGLVEGTAYYLGDDTGLQHYFVDTDVENGKTYYYGLVAYDYGIKELGLGVAPAENNLILELDEAEEVRFHSRNVAIVTPRQVGAGYCPPQFEVISQTFPPSLGSVVPSILTPDSVRLNRTYRLQFLNDTLAQFKQVKNAIRFTTCGYRVLDVTDGGSRLVAEWFQRSADNTKAPNKIKYVDSLLAYTIPTGESIEVDQFEGLNCAFRMEYPLSTPVRMDAADTGWRTGNSDGGVRLSVATIPFYVGYMPWEYEFVFGDPGVYTTRTKNLNRVKDEMDKKVSRSRLLLDAPLPLQALVRNFTDSTGQFMMLDIIAVDADSNGAFDLLKDKLLVGPLDDKTTWFFTLFALTFEEGSAAPQPNDVYRLSFQRPFHQSDGFTFRVLPSAAADPARLRAAMDSIQAVPNPYVATNHFEPSVANYRLNQRRQILFTHLPARCTIKIFSVSGVLVDELNVENPADNGTAFWDLLTREDLEVSAGVYVYHVKAAETNDEKIGKLAIIK